MSDGSVDGVPLGVAMAVWVTVAVGVEGVEVGVAVGVGVGTGSWVLLIRIRGAFAFVPLCTNSAANSYSPGATAPIFNVVTREVWVGRIESAITFFPFVLSTLSFSRYLFS